MKVFKFGGASTRDASQVKNVLSVVQQSKEKNLLIVVSAMGKITNALEKVIHHYLNTGSAKAALNDIYHFHLAIVQDLFPEENHAIYKTIKELCGEIERFLKDNKSKNHAYVYDQVICYGELLSSVIVCAYFNENGLAATWQDVRSCIKTDANYRDANVNWELTEKKIKQNIATEGLTITQGFLGAEEENNFTTTLGREGSDYSAAIFAYGLDAESVTIWKDVPGVLNADPRYFSQTQLLNRISYREAIELAFYGASVIHPKTLQPLQRKNIPLYVRSFIEPEKPGTCVSEGIAIEPETSCFILKKNLTLISLASKDFEFMMEDHIGDVFKTLHHYKMKVELIQNSAISFSVCINDKFQNLDALLQKLREKFLVKWNEEVTLYTIRHFKPDEIQNFGLGKHILLKQETQETVQLIIKE